MAVKIPRLQRFQGAQDSGSGRIQARVQDQAGNILQNTNSIASLAGEGIDLYAQVQKQELEKITNNLIAERRGVVKNRLKGLEEVKGDPTAAYQKFFEEDQKHLEELQAKYADKPSNARQIIDEKLAGVNASLRLEALNQKGVQESTYAHGVYKSNLSAYQEDAILHSGNKNAFDSSVLQIMKHVRDRGVATGTIEETLDESKGIKKYKPSPLAIKEQREAVGQAVTNAAKVLLSSGQQGRAREIINKYEDYIDGKDRAIIENKFKDADSKDEAFDIMNKYKGNIEAIEAAYKDKEGNPIFSEAKEKALEMLEIREKRKVARTKMQGTQYYNSLSKEVAGVMSSSNPYFGVSELENNKIYRSEEWDKMSYTQQQAIKEQIVQPKTSVPKSLTKINKLFFDEDDNSVQISEMTYEDFSTYLVGLSNYDRKKYTRMYEKFKTPSFTQQRGRAKLAKTFLIESLVQLDEVTRDRSQPNYFDDDDWNKINRGSDKILTYLTDFDGVPTDDAIRKFSHDIALQISKDENKIKPNYSILSPTGKLKKKEGLNLSPTETTYYKRLYLQKGNKAIPRKGTPGWSDFERFVIQNRKKGK